MADRFHIFQLSEPIKTHDGDVNELKLKYPRARCFIKYGVPYRNIVERTEDGVQRNSLEFDTKRMFSFVADMSGHDEIVLGAMAGQDVLPLFYTVTNMLSGGGDQLGEPDGRSG